MRHYLLLVLFLSLVSFSFGQTPSAQPQPSPSASPEKRRDFGSSLKRYEKKQRRDSQDKQKNDDSNDDEVIRVKTDLVVNDLLVSNQKGNMIIGLQKDDFVVTEDGVPQTIGTFSFGENASIPRSIVLILDYSIPQGPYLKNSIAAAKVLVDKFGPNDKMAIVADIKLRLEFTSDKKLLQQTLDSIGAEWNYEVAARSYASEFSALLAVLNEMFDEPDRQRIIIFQTDGVHGMWLKPDKDTPYRVSYSTLLNSGMRWEGE